MKHVTARGIVCVDSVFISSLFQAPEKNLDLRYLVTES